MALDQNIGMVTAYAYAKSKGYTGTEDEFAEAMADAGTTLEDITDAVDEFIETTVPAKVAEVTAEGTRQIGLVQSEGTEQIGLVSAEGTEQIGLVEAAGTAKISAVESAIEEKGQETIDSIPDDYSSLSSQIGFSLKNVVDVTQYTSSNAAVTYNGDGTYTIGATDYGTTTFNNGKQVKLEAGEYELYGVPNGSAFVATSNSFSTAIVTNNTSNPIRFTLTEAQANYYYIGFYIKPKPSTSFTISPYLKKVDSSISENSDRLTKIEELIENTYNLANFGEQVLTFNNVMIRTHSDGTVSLVGTASASNRTPYLLTLELGAGNYRLFTENGGDLNIVAYKTSNNTMISSGAFTLSEATTVGLAFALVQNTVYNKEVLVFLAKSDFYLSPIKATTAIDDVARAQIDTIINPSNAPYNTDYLLSVDSKADRAWTQGACCIGDKMIGFDASTSTTANYYVSDIFDYTNKHAYTHNLGHCLSADYNVKTDVMMVSNGSTDTTLLPLMYLVSDAKNTVKNGDSILTSSENVMAIDLSGIGGYEFTCCFGESECFAYAITATATGKNFFKLLLGMGDNDLTSLYQSDSYGTYVSGKNSDEYNGTVHVLKMIAVTDITGELQGLKYLNGKLIMPADEFVDGILTAFISIIKMSDDNVLLEKNWWIPLTDNVGNMVRTECEDVIFHNGVGYVVTRSELNGSNIFYTNKFVL